MNTKETKTLEFILKEDGVYQDDKGNLVRICSWLTIEAETRDSNGSNWGRKLKWKDKDGRIHDWTMPISKTAGDGLAVREYLLSEGVELEPGKKSKDALTRYLNSGSAKRITCVNQPGWNGNSYVLPNQTIKSQTDDQVILQSEVNPNQHYTSRGSLEEWTLNIGNYLKGNHSLTLGACLAFASPLVRLLNEESFGIHLVGASSTGKSTTLYVAGSIWGGIQDQGYIQTWRSTSNGLEGIAELHNDSLLNLDELGELDPKHAAEVAYQLAHGRGKRRATRNGDLRSPKSWKLLFLSSGEIKLSNLVEQTGGKIRAGQEVRMIDISVGESKYGAFESLHGFDNGSDFSLHLVNNSKKFNGTPIRGFLTNLVNDRNSNLRRLKALKIEASTHFVSTTNGQVSRVARKFSFIAAAGILASELGILPIEKEQIILSIQNCLDRWVSERGNLNDSEEERAVSQVRKYIQQNRHAKFKPTGLEAEESSYFKIIDQSGYLKTSRNGDKFFLFFPAVFKEDVCKGLNSQYVLRILKKAGLLKTAGPSDSETFTYLSRVSDSNKPSRFIAVSFRILEAEDVTSLQTESPPKDSEIFEDFH